MKSRQKLLLYEALGDLSTPPPYTRPDVQPHGHGGESNRIWRAKMSILEQFTPLPWVIARCLWTILVFLKMVPPPVETSTASGSILFLGDRLEALGQAGQDCQARFSTTAHNRTVSLTRSRADRNSGDGLGTLQVSCPPTLPGYKPRCREPGEAWGYQVIDRIDDASDGEGRILE